MDNVSRIVPRFWSALACAAMLFALPAPGESTEVNATSSATRLVIVGASYAGSWGKPDLPGYEVINRGVAGEETAQVRARFDGDVLSLKPGVVLIWGHINNIHRAPAGAMDATLERAKADYIDMISRSIHSGSEVALATEVTLSEAVGWRNRIAALIGSMRGKESYSARVNGYVRTLNNWLRAYARQEGLLLLDFEQVFDDGRGFRKVEYTSEDGSHISKAGYAALTAYARGRLSVPLRQAL